MSKRTKKRQVYKRKKLVNELCHLVRQKKIPVPEFFGIHNPYAKNGILYIVVEFGRQLPDGTLYCWKDHLHLGYYLNLVKNEYN